MVHLGALGAVVRSTSLLSLIRQKYPQSLVTWVTDRPADQLLQSHPLIDRVLTTSSEDLLQLTALQFDAAFVIDKSLKACGVLRQVRAAKIFGFQADSLTGAILPASSAAEELWHLGLNNRKKFFENQKSEVQLMCEALELPWQGRVPEYNLPLNELETQATRQRRRHWQMDVHQPVIGINTGCSSVIPAKKLTVEYQRKLVEKLGNQGFQNVVLLGGPEDTVRNSEIGRELPVFQSPTDRGLRDGLVSVEACDFVITGDSLGLHMAIARKKFVIAWFGPTCSQEIELYGRGIKIQSSVTCGPCWKRSCDKVQMCYDQVSLESVLQAVQKGLHQWHQAGESLSFKPLF